MKTIFSYDDYRKYLADYYAEKKAGSKRFSYQLFSAEAGFANKGFLFNVIQGSRNLSRSSIFQLAQALKLAKSEAEYFENLVFFNQATNYRERQHFFDCMTLSKTNSSQGSRAKKLREEQFELYSRWYNAVIRSILDLCPFKDDYNWLAKMVSPNITPKQAKKSVELLERLGLLRKKENGIRELSDPVITTGPEVNSLAVQKFHLDMMGLAAKAVEGLPKSERNVTGLTVNLSKDSYAAVCRKILACQEEIMAIVRDEKKATQVYQLCYYLFPVSSPSNGKSKPAKPRKQGRNSAQSQGSHQ